MPDEVMQIPDDIKFSLGHMLARIPENLRADELVLAGAILKSGFFDVNYYLAEYPDVESSFLDPALHFIRFGFRENRKPAGWLNGHATSVKKQDAEMLSFFEYLQTVLGSQTLKN